MIERFVPRVDFDSYEDFKESYRAVSYTHLRDFKTPDFYKKAVMYQIFPDRYAQGNSANARRGIDYHRAMGRTVYLHGSFDETPFYLSLIHISLQKLG